MGEFQPSVRKLVGLYSQVLLLMTYSPIIDPSNYDKNHSGLSYSPSLEAAVQLLLADPAFQDDPGTSSLKFIWAARFLKDNAPHVFHVREMRTGTRNSMDRWLWDLLG
jgi:hypothetical protein